MFELLAHAPTTKRSGRRLMMTLLVGAHWRVSESGTARAAGEAPDAQALRPVPMRICVRIGGRRPSPAQAVAEIAGETAGRCRRPQQPGAVMGRRQHRYGRAGHACLRPPPKNLNSTLEGFVPVLPGFHLDWQLPKRRQGTRAERREVMLGMKRPHLKDRPEVCPIASVSVDAAWCPACSDALRHW